MKPNTAFEKIGSITKRTLYVSSDIKFNGYNMNTNGYRSHCIVKYFSKKSYFFLFTANL